MTARQTPAIVLQVRDYGEADRLVYFLTPATCCLISPDREKTVTKAYVWLRDISSRLREKYHFP
jgi:hypothetical protein